VTVRHGLRVLLGIAVGAVLAGALYVNVLRPGASSGDRYRVDVVFDTAKGIVPGQVVKIAGARVGRVADVALTRDHQARLSLDVERRFAPFHANARCTIKPEGLLSENFVQCDPGSSSARPLSGATPTVPVDRTTVPVSLNDLFNIWNVPTRERLRLLVNELGLAGAGRGEDLNALLRRSNPALGSARRVLSILHQQDAELGSAIDATDTISARLAQRPQDLSRLIDSTAKVTARTAARSRQLAQSVQRLPALLSATRPALTRLRATARTARPVLADLRQAGPALARVLRAAPPLARAALPTVDQLGAPLARGRGALNKLRTSSELLDSFSLQAQRTGVPLEQLLTNLRQRGALEYLLSFSYENAALLARFDKYSHMLPGFFMGGICSGFATTPVAGCSSHIGPVVGQAAPAKAKRQSAAKRPQAATPPAPSPTPVSSAAGPAPPVDLHNPLKPAVDAVKSLLDYLLKP
jgi:ABC-type transporter Mla subunit MlaD